MTLNTNKQAGDTIEPTEWNEAATAANEVTDGTLTITESQISDLGEYITDYNVTNSDLTGLNISELTNDSGFITSYTVTKSDVTQYESNLTITESQISDLGNYLTTVDVSDINATGTADGTTYLRGDGTWSTVSGGSGDISGSTGSTDNAILRADGTGGSTLQSSKAQISDNGDITLGDGNNTETNLNFSTDSTYTSFVKVDNTNNLEFTNVNSLIFPADSTFVSHEIILYSYAGPNTSPATTITSSDIKVDAINEDPHLLSGVNIEGVDFKNGAITNVSTLNGVDPSTYLTDYTVTNSDLTGLNISELTNDSDYITDYTVTENDVTQYESNLTITESQISDLNHYTSSDFDTDFGTKSTDDLAEGTNLYYTDNRVSNNTDVSANTAHRTSDGSDHTFIDQDVTSGSNPTFGDISYSTATSTIPAFSNLGSAYTVDFATGTHFSGILNSDVTLTFSNAVSGDKITLILEYDGSAQRTITYPSDIMWSGGSAPDTPASTGKLVITILYDGVNYLASGVVFN